MKKTFTYPTYATDMPLNIYTRVESNAAGQATVYFKNALGASEYAIYTYTNGKYTYAGKVAAVNNANTKYLSYTIKNMTVSGRCGFVVRALFGNPVTKTNETSFTQTFRAAQLQSPRSLPQRQATVRLHLTGLL